MEKQCFTLAESLLRLPATPLGPLYPSEFIPLAEETGLIVDITYYVLDTVCRFIHDLLESGITMLESVTVNFSGVQFSPVSYTHLDVYKRQILNHRSFSHQAMRPCALMRY